MKKIYQPITVVYTAQNYRYRIVKEKGRIFVFGSKDNSPERLLSPVMAQNILESARDKGLKV